MNRQKNIYREKPSSTPHNRALKQCACGNWFDLPLCHAERHRSCSSTCARERRGKEIASRERKCVECGTRFIPRKVQVRNGGGRFCTVKCAGKAIVRDVLSSPEMATIRAANRRRNEEAGITIRPRGELDIRWKGGPIASRRRAIASGKAAEQLRQYRSANPEKAREWAQSRQRRKYGRLPAGTVAMKLEAQSWRCPYCNSCLRSGYHVDHIVPLSKGGRHLPDNIQCTCPTCNVRKSDKMPDVFAAQMKRSRIMEAFAA